MCVNITSAGLNCTIENNTFVNKSDLTVLCAFVCNYQQFVAKHREQVESYKMVGYVLGTLIILSNIVVVISTGFILKKGSQSKSTYLILGNVSLADTIVGFSLIFALAIDNVTSDNVLCIVQMGLLVCPAMVSIFSVGLIAVDRYLYILHGLYYQRWFRSSRVRFGILFIWIISIILGFIPATGWVNQETSSTHCSYVSLYPGQAILLNSLLSIIPIAIVGVLYTIILIKALKTVNNLNAAQKVQDNAVTKPKLRMYRGTVNYNEKNSPNSLEVPSDLSTVNKSASFSLECLKDFKPTENSDSIVKSRSNCELSDIRKNSSNKLDDNKVDDNSNSMKNNNRSELSVYTIDSDGTETNDTTKNARESLHEIPNCRNKNKNLRKTKEPNKWRAVTVVMLTSGSVIVTWMPFFFAVIFYVFCEEYLSARCLYIRLIVSGPLSTLAFLNSILNPLIYAWWHKGFQRSVRSFYKKYLQKSFLICR